MCRETLRRQRQHFAAFFLHAPCSASAAQVFDFRTGRRLLQQGDYQALGELRSGDTAANKRVLLLLLLL